MIELILLRFPCGFVESFDKRIQNKFDYFAAFVFDFTLSFHSKDQAERPFEFF